MQCLHAIRAASEEVFGNQKIAFEVLGGLTIHWQRVWHTDLQFSANDLFFFPSFISLLLFSHLNL